MGKYSEADIDAILKQIRDTVDKQSVNNTPESENSLKDVSPDNLIDKVKASIDDDVTLSKENEDNKDNYDISGFEIEEEVEPVTDEKEEAEVISFANSEADALEPVEEEDGPTEDFNGFVEEINDSVEEADTFKEAVENEPTEIFDELSVSEEPKLFDDESDEAIEEAVEVFDDSLILEEDNGVTEEVKETDEALTNGSMDEAAAELVNDAPEFVNDATEPVNDVPELVNDATELVNDASELVNDASELKDDTTLITENFEPAKEICEEVTSLFFAGNGSESTEEIDSAHKLELDESDINVAISLGSKEALEDSIGFVRVREARSNFIDPTVKKNLSSIVFDYKNNEYRGDNSAQIKGGYRKEKKRIARRLVFSSIIFFLTLFLEAVYYSSARISFISDMLDKPYVYGVSVTVLLLSVVFISLRKMVYGFVGFISTHPNYYTTAGMIVFVNLLYSIIMIFAFKNDRIFLFNSVVILALILDIIGEYMHISREILTFELVSDGRPKLSLERQERTIETVKKESYLNKREFYIENTSFVGKYFERTARLPSFYYIDYVYNVIFSMIALIVAVGTMVYTKNLSYAVLSFDLLLTVSIPLQREFLTALPIYMISRRLSKQDSAIIGESVVDEYVGKNTIYLDDVEMFGRHGVKAVNLKTYNNFNVIDINYYYMSLFSKISGPLKNAFGDESKKINKSDDAKLLNVFDGGIEALIDGTNKVFVGNHSFFESHNLVSKLPEERKSVSDDLVTMYMSVNGALCAEFQFKYIIDKHFESFAGDMALSGAEVGIRTMDPNISEEMIKKIRRTSEYTIRVTRPTLNDIVPIGRRSDSGIITCKSHHMIPKILDMCLEIKRIKHRQTLIWLIYSVVSVIAIALMAFFNVLNHVFSFYIIAYQMIWSFGIAVFVVNKLKSRK